MRQNLKHVRFGASGAWVTYLPVLAPPTQKMAYEKLLHQETQNELAGLKARCGFTQLINSALKLEHEQ